MAWIQGQSGCSKTFFAKRIAEYLIKSKRRGSNKDKLINDDLISLINLKDCDSETLENKFESLSLRVRVVILDDINDPLRLHDISIPDVTSPSQRYEYRVFKKLK